ncbi:MAG: hypothetical protein KF851_13290 [Pirellulaceae bacterium]|nr:hypothetical protein [Pirellulaceae bacterium]
MEFDLLLLDACQQTMENEGSEILTIVIVAIDSKFGLEAGNADRAEFFSTE